MIELPANCLLIAWGCTAVYIKKNLQMCKNCVYAES